MTPPKLSRRCFLRKAVPTMAGCMALPVFIPDSAWGGNGHVAPSNRITVGCIGVGGHGTNVNLRGFLAQADARVMAVCDVDANNMERARGLVNGKYGNQDCATTKDFRGIIDRTDIDAVMISTPDHWHTPISVMAAKAGKDICCEKPTLTIGEGRVLVNTIRRYGRVFQTSTEDRSLSVYHRMAELVRNGRIGKLHTIHVELPHQPNTAGDPTPMPVPPELDYDMWLGPAPYAPYTKDRVHFHFRWLWDYSGGIITDWGTHLFDTAQWGNDTEFSGPTKINATGTFWNTGLYNTPKEYHVEYEYANGVKMFVKDGTPSIRFEGTKGWVGNRGWIGRFQASDEKIMKSVIGPHETHLFTCAGGEHRNFLDCVKSRKDPYFSVEIGHRVSTVCHLANISLLLGRPLNWDPNKEVFINDVQANQMCQRSMRGPWHL
jgi:predicted dehydrogenase